MLRLVAESYYVNESWKQIESINDEIENDDDKSEYYQEIGKRFLDAAISAESEPFLKEYTSFLSQINHCIQEFVNESAQLDVDKDELLNRIEDELLAYVQSVKTVTEEFETVYQDHKNLNISTFKPKWRWSNGFKDQFGDDVSKPFERNFNELLDYLKNEEVPDEVVKFILNPTYGTAGIEAQGVTRSPLMLSTLPSLYALENSDVIWEDRNRNREANKAPIPTEIDDDYQADCEEEFLESLKHEDIDHIVHSRRERTEESRRKRDQEKDKQDETENDNKSQTDPAENSNSNEDEQTHTNTQSTIPDDTSYTPNIQLMIHAKGYTKEVQARPQGELFHDHMTRFKTNVEEPRSMSESEVIKGPGHDFVIFLSNQRGRNKYVVTYTRKSRKPIFNSVA
jgi:hypothetical protein